MKASAAPSAERWNTCFYFFAAAQQLQSKKMVPCKKEAEAKFGIAGGADLVLVSLLFLSPRFVIVAFQLQSGTIIQKKKEELQRNSCATGAQEEI